MSLLVRLAHHSFTGEGGPQACGAVLQSSNCATMQYINSRRLAVKAFQGRNFFRPDLPSHQIGEFVFHTSDLEQADLLTRLEFDEDVDVTRRFEIVTKDRPEKGELPDMVPPEREQSISQKPPLWVYFLTLGDTQYNMEIIQISQTMGGNRRTESDEFSVVLLCLFISETAGLTD